MKKAHKLFIQLFILISVFIIYSYSANIAIDQTEKPITVENDSIKVSFETATGCFTVVEKISGQIWSPDPWDKSAGLLTIRRKTGQKVETIRIPNIF